jgi:hypothetical protein
VAFWGGGGGAFSQPVALGEGNLRRVSGGVEVKKGSRRPGEAYCTGGQAREAVVCRGDGGGSTQEQQWGIMDMGLSGPAIYRRKSPSRVIATSPVPNRIKDPLKI